MTRENDIRSTKGWRVALLALVTAMTLVASACGSDDEAAPATTAVAATTVAPATTAAAAPATTAAAAPATTAAAAPATTAAAPESFNVAYLSASSANTWLAASREQMEMVAAGANVTMTEFDAQFDPGLQTTQMQDVVASGQYDGIIVTAIIGPGLAPDIEAVLDAGLEVVVLNQVVGTDLTTADPQVDGVAASVMMPPQRSGERLGALAVQACEGNDSCGVVFIYGIKGIPLDDALRSGFDSVIADHANISVVAEGEGQYLGPEGGMNAIQDIMQATPDFDVVVGADQSIEGIEIVLEEEGMLGSVKLIGLGGSAAAIQGISNGSWFGGIYGAPGDEGRYAMEAMVAALRDGTVTGGIDPAEALPDGGLVTAANVSQFEAQWGVAPAPPPPTPESFNVAYLSASSANTWLAASREQMEMVAAGANVTMTEFDAQFDPGLQTTQMQDVVASGQYDGIIVTAIIGPGLAPDIEAVLDAGLEVVVLNQVVGTDLTTADPQVDGVAASVMMPPQRSGERLGALAVQACEGNDSCGVVFIYGIKGIPLDDALRSGFDSVIADHANISVVAEGEGQYLGPEGGMNAIQDIMQATPDFDVVVGADQSIEGIEIVLEEEGMLGSVKLIGLGGSAAAIQGISNGSWFGGIYGAPGDEGRYAMEAMVAALRDGTVTGGIDPAEALPDGGLVTAANVSQFEAQWEG